MSVGGVVATAIAAALGLHFCLFGFLRLALRLLAPRDDSTAPVRRTTPRVSYATASTQTMETRVSYATASTQTMETVGCRRDTDERLLPMAERAEDEGDLHHTGGAPTVQDISGHHEGKGNSPIASQGILPGDLLAEVVECCHEADLMNIATASRDLWQITRSRRFRTLVIRPRRFFSFAKWLYARAIESKSPAQALYTPIPGLNFTMPITEFGRDPLDRYVRTLVLPTRWTEGTAAFLKVIAALAPSGIHTLVLGGRNEQHAWYAQMWQAWVPVTMDPLLKNVKTLVFHEPTNDGLHFILRRRPTGDGPALSETVRSIEIQPPQMDSDGAPPNSWYELWWDEGTVPGDAAGDEDKDLLLAVSSLHVHLVAGIRGVMTGLHFPCLEALTLELTLMYGDDWEFVDRLLTECADKLRRLRVMAREEAAFDDVLDIRKDLTQLIRVEVDWRALTALAGLEHVTSLGMVEVIVRTYDSDVAVASEYDEARRTLTTGHWKRVAVVDKPFLKLPGQESMREDHHQNLKRRLNWSQIEFE
ncbi:uncharacterized protein SCHCODRAFT_02705848 [Schizophyllum commune H4-8]|uniref:F-box domain-containing protein n=1 Tax=Schizophyllum commune (strain H4-8 / FGSC 9210) TaxID=578458 RepID=D8QHW6_SCHCM|nr:uncharacterized protein SCHCODRAFT_02666172 [Schizophyllum commune H4-8]XP_003027655.1 uncharacterized protein SCHCODRAFT_02705837 [Schizophyllum commune H4-8]XP_050198056.1 uncharacterized protein SCHCODRAFT_02705848 [Schizophyllum commune H4-8]KAI5887367.1 hypothetical protein SCHCODRAFT_02705837 [Schizophyllum commune H4-8]KAI5887380.1 hypothetical protein SCHCODRAFT_02705848 [Schizophyllum commune H4-8]KAI5892996.1 hypothetical protein SCHCODRAFT_02666172 [Schizophyllum commune H4-8]